MNYMRKNNKQITPTNERGAGRPKEFSHRITCLLNEKQYAWVINNGLSKAIRSAIDSKMTPEK